MRSLIVGAQLAVSLVLLLMAGLLVQVLRRGLDVDPGLVADNVAIAAVQLGPHGYDENRSWELVNSTLEQIRANPEVAAATVGRWMPLSGSTYGGSVVPVGADADASPINIYFGAVHPPTSRPCRCRFSPAGRSRRSKAGSRWPESRS